MRGAARFPQMNPSAVAPAYLSARNRNFRFVQLIQSAELRRLACARELRLGETLAHNTTRRITVELSGARAGV
jgi:hypothetical protein